MGDKRGRDDPTAVILYLAIVAAVLLFLGTIAFQLYGSAGVTVLDLSVSAILTAALVILYFRQTTILESQKELLTQELNREARQKHTETLRERIRIWHGDPDNEQPENPVQTPDLNIPVIRRTSFQSSPGEFMEAAFPGDEDSFQAIPAQLQGDRYLEDLLENHAPDLREKKERIEELHEQFTSLRDEFIAEYDDGVLIEKEEYTLEPVDSLATWIFERVILKERGYYEDFDELRERALESVSDGQTSIHPDEPKIWVQVSVGNMAAAGIYSANVSSDSRNREEYHELRPEAKEHAEEAVSQVLEKIDEEYPYELAHEAAGILDEAEEEVVELERILMEYEGRPIYPGDCKYLEEARL
jgi:hypothetical protein